MGRACRTHSVRSVQAHSALYLREMNIIVCRTVDHAKNTSDCSLHAVLCIILLVVRYPVDLGWIFLCNKTN